MSDGKNIELDEVCHISQINDLRQELLSAVESGSAITVDCSKVERVDSPTIQLLLSAKKSAAMAGVEVSFTDISGSMLVAITTLGLQKNLGIEA